MTRVTRCKFIWFHTFSIVIAYINVFECVESSTKRLMHFGDDDEDDEDENDDRRRRFRNPVQMKVQTRFEYFNECVQAGNIEEVNRQLMNGYDVNTVDDEGNSALFSCLFFDDKSMFDTLMKYNADLTARTPGGISVVMEAVESGLYYHFLWMTEELQKRIPLVQLNSPLHIKEDGTTLLMMACEAGSIPIVDMLLMAGFDPCSQNMEGHTSLHFAVRGYNTNDNRLFAALLASAPLGLINMKDIHGNTVLHQVCSQDHRQSTLLCRHTKSIVEYLLGMGATVSCTNLKKETALHIAAYKSVDVIDVLCLAGSDSSAKDITGRTPIHRAITCKDKPTSWKIIDDMDNNDRNFKGFFFGIRDDKGMTPLLLAYSVSNFIVVAELLKRRHTLGPKSNPAYFDINEFDNERNTALHFCAMTGSINALENLVSRGASIYKTNSSGMTPLECATKGLQVSRTKKAIYNSNFPGNPDKFKLCVELLRLKIKIDSAEALMMALHKRLGKASPLNDFPEDLARKLVLHL
jgi:ankyrin repeat protein